ncbi:tRNA (adenosine(37)-N6)-dimethylallyltransferase MiaA [Candidatus Gottesmanbacteria bacterium]|nr:tRNA (adenosine(37)-N6)-dimethylallyltransferase MiaA [Candidatus Gottesmanbacteria bacterium]
MNKLLIICGPTATGKTALGEHLAKKFDGEIISADSRHVYKGIDIITGKDVPKDIPIHLIDVAEPDYIFNVGEYRTLTLKAVNNVSRSGKLPIIVGGTGLYVRSILKPLEDINIPPDKKLRQQLESLTKYSLQRKVSQLNPDWWKKANHSDKNNPRRLIRAIEIALSKEKRQGIKFLKFDTLIIGLTASKEYINKKIDQRVNKRLKMGALEEAKNILKKYKNPNLPAITSTGIRQLKEYIDGKESLPEAIKKWNLAEYQYAKRQITWFKKEKDINWFDIENSDFIAKIEAMVLKWYTP